MVGPQTGAAKDIKSWRHSNLATWDGGIYRNCNGARRPGQVQVRRQQLRYDRQCPIFADCVEKAGHQYPNMADRRHNDSSCE
jgi:hypothetical protein